MRRFLANVLKFAAPAALLCLGGANAPAAFITNLYDTGTVTSTTAGSALATAGSADAHYTEVSSTIAGATSAFVDTSYPGVYTPNTATSQWIGPNANGNTNFATGTITYSTTFTISGPFSAASLSGSVAADDYVTVSLNGHNLGTFTGYTSFQQFADTSASDFVSGTNTLTFTLTNDVATSPVNLEVNGLTGSYTPTTVPEPASVVLMGLGGLAAFGFSRVRRNRVA